MDDALASRLADDLDGTFEELVRSHQHLVFGIGLRLTADRRDAEEVAQDTFVQAYRALGGYDAERVRAMHLRAWLSRIAVNTAANKRRWRRHRGAEELPGEPAAPEWDGPAERVEAASGLAACAGLIGRLPLRYRAVVVLRLVEGLPYAEVAEAVDRPVGTVKAQVHRALAMLRVELGGELGGEVGDAMGDAMGDELEVKA